MKRKLVSMVMCMALGATMLAGCGNSANTSTGNAGASNDAAAKTDDAAAAKIVETAKRTGSRVAGPIPLPTNKEVITILRAVHKYKDSREPFEMRPHKRLIDVIRPTNKTVEALQSLELPAGVDMTLEA